MRVLILVFFLLFSFEVIAGSVSKQRNDPILQSDVYEEIIIMNQYLIETQRDYGYIDTEIKALRNRLISLEVLKLYDLDPGIESERQQLIRIITDYIVRSENEAINRLEK